MKKYRVNHVVLCEIRTWRTIEAENYADALAKVAALKCLTDTSTGADHEVFNDLEVKQLSIKEI